METARQVRFDMLGRLFRYPTEQYVADAAALATALDAIGSRAAESLAQFAAFAQSTTLHELEETYTRTFDLNPACAAEIGWHLFGEEYLRGLFMVRIRNEMRERGLEETGELPDHVVHLLALVAAMENDSARELARACMCPAVGKMQRSLEEGDPPFRPLVDALAELLLEEFDLPRETLHAEEGDTASFVESDPLRGPACGAGGCGGGGIPETVSLDLSRPRPAASTANTAKPAAAKETLP
ncbi:MAG: nitrate reductase molybdenum cofactor assembly chaperone [Pirellulales bacterium]